MTDEIVVSKEDHLAERPREEVEEAARKWFGIATEMKEIQGVLTKDLESALRICADYQRILTMLSAPDPNLVEVRNLLTKYKMSYTPPSESTGRVYVDGVDITEHPDSVPGEGHELILEETIETVELVRDDVSGAFKFIPVVTTAAEVDGLGLEIDDVEIVEDESRDWLKDD